MKWLSLCITGIGISMCAFYGAQIGTNVRVAQVLDGTIYVQRAAAKTAHQTYCEQRAAHGLADIDGCGTSERYSAVAPDRVHVDANDDLSPREALYRDIALLESVPAEAMDSIVHSTRNAWLSELRLILPLLAQQRTLPSVAPMTRLEHWWSISQLGFGGGFILMICGGLLFRRSDGKSAESVGEGSARPENASTALMDQLHTRLAALHHQAQHIHEPTYSELAALKQELENIQKEVLGPLIENGPRLQSRFGLTGYATVFSPLSSGERLLNRTWCTLVDQHWPEALRSLDRAVIDCAHARSALHTLESGKE